MPTVYDVGVTVLEAIAVIVRRGHVRLEVIPAVTVAIVGQAQIHLNTRIATDLLKVARPPLSHSVVVLEDFGTTTSGETVPLDESSARTFSTRVTVDSIPAVPPTFFRNFHLLTSSEPLEAMSLPDIHVNLRLLII